MYTKAYCQYYGWFFACPIYVGNIERPDPLVMVRWWVPEWWLDLNEWCFGVCVMLVQMVNPECDPMFPLRITGPLE